MDSFDIENKCFTFDGTSITNPTCSTDGFQIVSPSVYGFEVMATGGNCTAWVKPYEGGYIVLTNECTHKLEEPLTEFLMGFYDGVDDGDLWGNYLGGVTLQVGVIPDGVA